MSAIISDKDVLTSFKASFNLFFVSKAICWEFRPDESIIEISALEDLINTLTDSILEF